MQKPNGLSAGFESMENREGWRGEREGRVSYYKSANKRASDEEPEAERPRRP